MRPPHDSGHPRQPPGAAAPRPDQPGRLDAFVEHYGSKIYEWCRRWNLQEADAQDVTQNVLLKLAEKMRDFEYEPVRAASAPGSRP